MLDMLPTLDINNENRMRKRNLYLLAGILIHGLPWDGKIPWKREWQLSSVFLAGEFHEQRSLAHHSPWGHKESDTTESLTFFS